MESANDLRILLLSIIIPLITGWGAGEGGIKIQKLSKWIEICQSQSKNMNLLMLLSQTLLFPKRSIAVIDGSEKRNGWLNLELQSLHAIARRRKIFNKNIFLC